MNNYLQELRGCFSQGINCFFKDPIEYTKEVVADFVKDYWDLGIACLGSELVFGSNEIDKCTLGAILYIASTHQTALSDSEKNERARDYRIQRNTFAGFDYGLLRCMNFNVEPDSLLQILGATAGIVELISSINRELTRRKERNNAGL